MHLQPSGSGRAVGVFQLGKQKQIPLSADWSQLSKGPTVPHRAPGAWHRQWDPVKAPAPSQAARGGAACPSGTAASLGHRESPCCKAGGRKPLCPSHF